MLDLAHLESMTDEEAIEYLTGFDGVGLKTAACVLCFSLRRPVLPVDTHVLRVARRLGWVPATASATRAHRELERQVDPADRFALHIHMIEVGRRWCRPRNPACGRCALREECPREGVSGQDPGLRGGQDPG